MTKYKKAYHEVVMSCFDLLDNESKRELNQRLNEIFGKGHSEYLKEVENE